MTLNDRPQASHMGADEKDWVTMAREGHLPSAGAVKAAKRNQMTSAENVLKQVILRY